MIIVNNEAAIRLECAPVLSEEIGELVQVLENELSIANRLGKNGIGLAAPQIGLAKHIAIIRLPNISLNLVNAFLVKGFDKIMFRDEACLSFPNRVENTMRFQEVHIVNNLDTPHSFIAQGFISVAIQHELDHLNSILFMDRKVTKPQPLIAKQKAKPNDLCPCGSKVKYKRCCSR